MKARSLGAVALLVLAGCYTWVRWDGPATGIPRCEASRMVAKLDTTPQPRLNWFARNLAFASTPWKRRGVSGWRQTYCMAEGTGALVRDGQHSNDGFWTFDLQLTAIRIDTIARAVKNRYIRIEVEPSAAAQSVIRQAILRAGDSVRVSGVLLIDTDREGFLEIHPDSQLVVFARAATKNSATPPRMTNAPIRRGAPPA